ncbi:hypothetical protein PARPLA_02456 [Rhodobacteraceae bacterium THAF1]|uniref:DUF262 domain-containing protein n=1 Tax=Palleronia sp. THAF1 TaxID=2587842 RepID=UPI000F3AB66E|nr:DUF262 domain-containing protein [Palleronia sp. THAF1]QFU08846.1 hypothetical protein FIU81_09185 [Palleronia sp. THAF1]VDC27781.1 hypothetical protein PARPLA_02456 [Rhodobacteraceae bacterium THAF1]
MADWGTLRCDCVHRLGVIIIARRLPFTANPELPVHDIKGYDLSVQQLFSRGSFGIDYYQREYRWQTEQMRALVDDLASSFLEHYQPGATAAEVANYGHYFLGSIVVSQSGEIRHIVDGQQRLTSLTLLLIFLNHMQQDRQDKVSVAQLIYDDDFGQKKFKLDVPNRNACMEALFQGDDFNPVGHSDSVYNLVARFRELPEIFPEELRGDALPLFIYWLLRKVKVIEITAYAEGDAYTIFETMNDRGLSLTPTDMLKGYLLANIEEPDKRHEANVVMRDKISRLTDYGKDTAPEFFKAWVRSQYAKSIRARHKDARPEDYDLIGTEYHRWVRNHAARIGLVASPDYARFVLRDMRYYADLYVRLLEAARVRTPGLESIRYNADAGFTLQHQMLIAPITPEDSRELAEQKAGVVADFIDCWLNLRLWNYKSNSYSSMQYAAFLVMREIRGESLEGVRAILHARLLEERKELDFSTPVHLNQFTGKAVHRQLARFTDWLERQAGEPGRYEDYVVRSGKHAYEVEHIWANHHDRFATSFL